MAGVAQYSNPPSFLRGRRGTHGDCVARLVRICRQGRRRHFAWQAWHLVTFTLISRGRRGTNSHPPWFCVAGVALMVLCGALGPDLSPGAPRHFAWQAWHLVTFTFVSRGRRGTNSHPPSFLRGRRGTHGTVVARLGPDFVARGAAPLCVAGVALGDIHLRFTWQAWHKLTSPVVLRGRRGTDGRRDARDAARLLRGRRGAW